MSTRKMKAGTRVCWKGNGSDRPYREGSVKRATGQHVVIKWDDGNPSVSTVPVSVFKGDRYAVLEPSTSPAEPVATVPAAGEHGQATQDGPATEPAPETAPDTLPETPDPAPSPATEPTAAPADGAQVIRFQTKFTEPGLKGFRVLVVDGPTFLTIPEMQAAYPGATFLRQLPGKKGGEVAVAVKPQKEPKAPKAPRITPAVEAAPPAIYAAEELVKIDVGGRIRYGKVLVANAEGDTTVKVRLGCGMENDYRLADVRKWGIK